MAWKERGKFTIVNDDAEASYWTKQFFEPETWATDSDILCEATRVRVLPASN